MLVEGPSKGSARATGDGGVQRLRHDDEQDGDLDPIATDVEGLERVTLRSVGIDIGSATTHLVLARLGLRREGAALSARWTVTERRIDFRSGINLTPYRTDGSIDAERVFAIVGRGYAEAGVDSAAIHTGAVLVTGEALKRVNARPIAEHFASDAGRFICVSAGPNHEAILAAHGSGAVAKSSKTGQTVLHVDIGGGTTKVSLIRDGRITHTAATSVGARLLCVDESGRLTRVDLPGEAYLQAAGYPSIVGDRLPVSVQERCAALMWGVLVEVMNGAAGPFTEKFAVTAPLPAGTLARVDAVMVSGGVGEYVSGREKGRYGDLGPLLGEAVRQGLEGLFDPRAILTPLERIRATVIGASEYTVQASGQTNFIGEQDLLPIRALKVVPAIFDTQAVDESAVLRAALHKFDRTSIGPDIALGLSLQRSVDYAFMRRLASAIVGLLRDRPIRRLVVLVDIDVARSLGAMLVNDLGVREPLVVVDGIEVGELDYVDVGSAVNALGVLPVTIRTLAFPA